MNQKLNPSISCIIGGGERETVLSAFE